MTCRRSTLSRTRILPLARPGTRADPSLRTVEVAATSFHGRGDGRRRAGGYWAIAAAVAATKKKQRKAATKRMNGESNGTRFADLLAVFDPPAAHHALLHPPNNIKHHYYPRKSGAPSLPSNAVSTTFTHTLPRPRRLTGR